MVHAIDPALDRAPQGFASIDVGVASDVLLGGVLDDFMGVAQLLDPVVV